MSKVSKNLIFLSITVLYKPLQTSIRSHFATIHVCFCDNSEAKHNKRWHTKLNSGVLLQRKIINYIKTFVSRVQFHRNTSVTVLVCALLPVLEYDTEDQDQDCHVDEIAASVGRN